MTSIVLAGGRGVRLGQDKLWETIGDRAMIQRVIDPLTSLSDEILVVIAQGQAEPALPAVAKVVVDLYPGGGTLGGIYTGLVASSSSHSLVVACDMPFLNPSLLRYLVQISPGTDIVIPKVGEKLQPLHAIYSKECLDTLRQQVEQGKRRVSDFVELMKIKYKVRHVEEAEIDKFDPGHLSFFNVNTPADLERARALAAEIE